MDSDWQRVLVFAGEQGKFVQTWGSEVLYIGGYTGYNFNTKIGKFKTCFDSFEFDSILEADKYHPKAVKESHLLGRLGDIAFWDAKRECVVLFGGKMPFQANSSIKELQNDVLLYDVDNMRIDDQILFTEASIERRMHHCGFMIGDSIFSVGGICKDGSCLDEFIEIDIQTRKKSFARVSSGAAYITKHHSASMCSVFYP